MLSSPVNSLSNLDLCSSLVPVICSGHVVIHDEIVGCDISHNIIMITLFSMNLYIT